MAPYRTVSQEEHAEAPRDAGIVGDIIAQFADPLAFYRELVQNAIDADSPTVEVELVHDTRVMLVRVRDRGCGMTRDILENQLLVLFRSTKEKDKTKIGKFGIGFASVLSPNPNVVVVQTARDGRRLTLHLSRDLTYKLFDAGAATQTGTTIELELAMTVEEAQQFAHKSHDALVRWCRHATVPITLRTEIPGLEPAYASRIDRPLALDDAVVEVRGVSEDGQLTAIVGIARDAKPYCGFFNHGLTLYETREPLVGNLAFKIQDARLGHTLSRDNVRRDENFSRALGMVRTLAEEQLPRVIEKTLRDASHAEPSVIGKPEATDPGKWHRIAAAVIASEIGLTPNRWTLPLVDATPKGKTIDAEQIGRRMWTSAKSTPLTVALARVGIPIVETPEYGRALFERLRELIGAEAIDVSTEYTLVSPVQLSPADHVFTATLLEIFEACHRAPPALILARLHGAHDNLISIAGGADDAKYPALGNAYILDKDTVVSTPFTRTRRRAVVINAGHTLVVKARKNDDARIAAAHIARGVLLQNRILDDAKSSAILEYTLTKVPSP